jgi:hypothetical protein
MLIQAAQEAARHSGITGQFIVDGALLIATLKVVEAVISKVRPKRQNSNLKPGEAKVCGEHDKAIDEHGKALVELRTKDETREKAIDKLLHENREDHGKIFDQIGALAKEIRDRK